MPGQLGTGKGCMPDQMGQRLFFRGSGLGVRDGVRSWKGVGFASGLPEVTPFLTIRASVDADDSRASV